MPDILYLFLVVTIVSVDCRNNSETLRTLRFGQRVRTIRNEPVINEIKEDDVNDLSDQIRQLKVLFSPNTLFEFLLKGVAADITSMNYACLSTGRTY